jgi:hypothetical protein
LIDDIFNLVLFILRVLRRQLEKCISKELGSDGLKTGKERIGKTENLTVGEFSACIDKVKRAVARHSGGRRGYYEFIGNFIRTLSGCSQGRFVTLTFLPYRRRFHAQVSFFSLHCLVAICNFLRFRANRIFHLFPSSRFIFSQSNIEIQSQCTGAK